MQPKEDYLERRIIREMASRKEAEKLLEAKSLELFDKNLELQASAAELMHNVELISTIMDAVPHIVITCNEAFIIETANSAAVKLLGYSPAQLKGRDIGELWAGSADWTERLASDSFFIDSARVVKSDGSSFQGELTGRRTRVKDKPLIVMVLSDTSERRDAVRIRQEIYQQLHESRRLEAIGALSSGIAHELNTPIQFIGDNINFIGLSLKKIHESYRRYDLLKLECLRRGLLQEQVKHLESFNQEIDLLFLISEVYQAIQETVDGVRQVRDIILIMKEFAHPGAANPEPADVNKIVSSAITLCRSRHRDVVSLETELGEAVPQVVCRSGQIQQVLVNMIVNAVEAIEEQGGGDGVIRISTRQTDSGVAIEISDTGPGIPKALKEKIFDPFFTTKAVGKGTGQGLALAKDFINQHGGKLLLERRPGFATTFVIELPAQPPSDTKPKPLAQYA